jgi:hypothetical protein
MSNLKKTTWLLIIGALLTMSACGGGAPTQDPGAIFTAAVETAYAQVTLTAMVVTDTPAIPPTPTATITPLVTNTPLITDTPVASLTAFTVVGPTVEQCDKALFISVDPPYGNIGAPGDKYMVTWTVQNTGDCTWDDGYGMVFGYSTTGDPMGGPYWKGIPVDFVYPGEYVDMHIIITSPSSVGDYWGCWRMQNDRGTNYGDWLCVNIVVR